MDDARGTLGSMAARERVRSSLPLSLLHELNVNIKGTLRDTVQLTEMYYVSCNRSISVSTAENVNKTASRSLRYLASLLNMHSYILIILLLSLFFST